MLSQKQPLFIIAEDVEVEVAGSLILDRICVSTKVIKFFWPTRIRSNYSTRQEVTGKLPISNEITREYMTILSRQKYDIFKCYKLLYNLFIFA